MKLKVSNKMINENLKVGDVNAVLESLALTNQRFCNIYGNDSINSKSIIAAIRLINSQQSRIEVLESAIREFNKDQLAQENYAGDDDRYHEKLVNKEYQSILTLRNLMENKS